MEPRSPLADLFAKIVPIMQDLKRKRNSPLIFPPKPPHPELPPPSPTCLVVSAEHIVNQLKRPEHTDLANAKRSLTSVSASEVIELATSIRYKQEDATLRGELPVEVEDENHLQQMIAEATAAGTTLYLLFFHAQW